MKKYLLAKIIWNFPEYNESFSLNLTNCWNNLRCDCDELNWFWTSIVFHDFDKGWYGLIASVNPPLFLSEVHYIGVRCPSRFFPILFLSLIP